MKLAILAVLALAPGCALLGQGKSALDAQAAEANEDNVFALIQENNSYTAVDPHLPDSLKATRAARNVEAMKVATKLVESASEGASK